MVEVKTYVDINVFVYWLGKHPSLGETAYQWVKKIENAPRGKYVTSSLSVYETLVTMAGLTGSSLRDRYLVERVQESIVNLRGLVIKPLTTDDLTQASELMKRFDLDYEDALHLSTALESGAKEIVSNDKDFDKTELRRIFL